MSKRQGISEVEIRTQIHNPCVEFHLSYESEAVDPNFETGNEIQFMLTNNYNSSGYSIVKGIIQDKDKDVKAEGKRYDLSGRNYGLYLVNQPFRRDCALGEKASYISANSLLLEILKDTGIKKHRFQKSFKIGNKNVFFSNKYGDHPWFCGEFQNKYDALVWLFQQYSRAMNNTKWRFFIDFNNEIHWFEINNPRMNKKIFDPNQDEIVSMRLQSNSENIVNYLEGFGGGNYEFECYFAHKPSIEQHGILYGQPIKDSSVKTRKELEDMVKKEVLLKAHPVHSLTIVIQNYCDIYPGQQVMIPEDKEYGEKIFTVTDISIRGSPEEYQTTIQATTDETVIAPADQFQVIKAIVKNELDKSGPEVGTVVSVSGDRAKVRLPTGVIVDARVV
jgi:hypothetical protein